MYSMRATPQQRFVYGPFDIRRIHPGHIVNGYNDSASNIFEPFMLLDHKQCAIGSQTPLQTSDHDGVLTLVCRGAVASEDEHGERTLLSPRKVMWVADSATTPRQESTPLIAAEAIQLFFKLKDGTASPGVQVYERKEPEENKAAQWTPLLGEPGSGAPFIVNQSVWVYDTLLSARQALLAPHKPGMSTWLYVIDGEIIIQDEHFHKGDAVAQRSTPLPEITAFQDSALLCVLVPPSSSAIP